MKLQNEFYKNVKAMSYDLTESCSLNCDYCFTHSCHEKKVLDQSIFKKSIEEWCCNSIHNSLELTWWGGEPYIEFETMKELTKYCKEIATKYNKSIAFGATTNGVQASDEMLKWIRDNNIATLISLDGIKEAHDKHRKFPNGVGSWDVIYKNIQKFKDTKTSFSIRASISVDTLPYLFESFKFYINELKVYAFAFSPVHEDDWNDKAFEILEEQLDKIIDYAIKIKKEKDISVDLYHINQNVKALLKPKKKDDFFNPCGAGNTFFGMAVDGTIWPCHRFNKHGLSFEERIKKEACVGYYDKDLTYIDLKSPVLADVLTLLPNINDHCKDCIIQKYINCNTGCVATNYDLTGCSTKCLNSNCVYQKILLDKAKEFIYKLLKNDIKILDYFGLQGMNNATCNCYQSQFNPVPEIVAKFLDLSRRIIATNDLEKTDEQIRLENEVLQRTVNMLLNK